MPAAPRTSPLEGTSLLLIDGTNLLYRLGTAAGGPAPASAIVGRIRATVPVTIPIDLVFDGVGHGVFGRLAQRMTVRYAGRKTADEVILDLASEYTMQHGGPASADRVLVVTNDRGLRDQLAAKGARTAPLQWLISRLDVPAAASAPSKVPASPGSGGAAAAPSSRRTGIGAGRAPRSGAGGVNAPKDDDARPGWKPGRGATAKSGVPKKVARHKRKPRPGA